MKTRPSPLWLAGIAAALTLGSPLQGQEPEPAQAQAQAQAQELPAAGETLDYIHDRTRRMTVPVAIGSSGPHRFIVDTGAERTVISRELAQQLDLDPGATAIVHSMSEVSRISTVIIPELRVGSRTVNSIHAPALAERHLGAVGMLGVDSLQSQRVDFDFVRDEMTVTASRRPEVRWPSDTIVITARNRYGHLVLIDASIEGQRVYVILDTGSQVSVGNTALRRRLDRRNRMSERVPVLLTSITGGTVMGEFSIAPQIRLGGVDLENIPIAFADAHPFRKLNLLDRPALLLGMDALELFERVSVDFANRRVRLVRPNSGFGGMRRYSSLPRRPAPREAGESRSSDSGSSLP